MKSFQNIQLEFTRYLRSPGETPMPGGIAPRRMEIYRDLIYNNIESLVVSVFPVLRSVLGDQQWHALVRQFIQEHACQTPYFLEISEEFLAFLSRSPALLAEYPFAIELAHYEWIELALDVSTDELPESAFAPQTITETTFFLSPLAVVLHYQYPVHKISSGYKPLAPDPASLVVYRNRDDKVQFIEINSVTSRLLFLMHQHADLCLNECIKIIIQELQHPNPSQLSAEASSLVMELCALGVLFPKTP